MADFILQIDLYKLSLCDPRHTRVRRRSSRQVAFPVLVEMKLRAVLMVLVVAIWGSTLCDQGALNDAHLPPST
jgi:hypothetical protein